MKHKQKPPIDADRELAPLTATSLAESDASPARRPYSVVCGVGLRKAAAGAEWRRFEYVFMIDPG